LEALQHRLTHMNPRAPQKVVHFGEVSLAEVFDLRGFNLNAKLDIDPDFLKEEAPHVHDEHCGHDEHDHAHDHGHEKAHDHHDHAHGENCNHPSHQGEGHGHHHHFDDDVKSFVFKSEKPFDPAKLEDFFGRHCECVWASHASLQRCVEHEWHRKKSHFPGRPSADGE